MPKNQNPEGSNVLDRFFSGLSESIFHGQLGVVDVQIVDYISGLLTRFLRSDSMHRIRRSTSSDGSGFQKGAAGSPVTEVVEMLFEAERRVGLAKREVHRHVGDFTLFWSGMYPESLRRLQSDDSPDQFVDYCQQGKRAYAIASSIEGGEGRPSCEVLRRMSEQFDMCAYGLREVRRELEQRDDDSPGRSTLLF